MDQPPCWVTVELNPGSSAPPPGGDLLHARAVGATDTLHFLFCSQGAPTLLLVHTNSSSSSLTVNWTQFEARNVSGSLKVEPESSILYSSAIVFSRLLEYDDVNDTADPTSDLLPPYDLQNFTWSRLNLSADSSQLKVSLDGVLPRATRSRFVLELQAVGGADPLSRVEVRRFIDDEFTPSIFKMSRWVSSGNRSSEVLGFLQWKPVAYRRADPALEFATPCRHSDPRPQTVAASALIRGFYAEPQTNGLNVSFGLAGEPFYNSTKFLSWTVLLGSGSPPVDSFSPLVLTLMAVGLGTPMILLLVGGVCVCVRKRAVAYEQIN
ncbi:Glycosylated lysosomal membrane protein [Liparis tanakae]|uniref:Glycosylated lysosomal membrane protein n=1 Tax=Liparis tanakae TaxID=230148 RepID=A0A4Z2GXK6_9TELE|nr:Glycosylated lysosomal membrane protein [Liparis tanakae]